MIYQYIKDSGYPPTFEEMRQCLGVSSNQAIIDLLEKLEDKKLIQKGEGTARTIVILSKGYEILKKKQLAPLVGISSAGSFAESFIDGSDKWMSLPQIPEHEKINLLQNDVFILQVYGDSMINASINDGDLLLVKKINDSEYRSGDIVVARNDDGTTVKRFVAEPGGRTYLKPENPAYDKILMYPETVFEGKVILNLSSINKNL